MLNIYWLEQRIEEEMEAGRVPGLSLAIVQGNEVTYARGFGVTNVEDWGIPVTPQTLFRIGSVTKPHTGTAIMRLVEQGKLDLDAPVKEYLDWFTLFDGQHTSQVTLRLLMSHFAGLPTEWRGWGTREPYGLEASLREEIPSYPLLGPPGKIWSYSNPSIRLAGHIAELAYGKSFAELVQELVFDPLEMRHTTFDPLVAMTYPLAQSHALDADGVPRVQHRFAENTARYPAGLMMSTVLDLSNFAIMNMSQGAFRSNQIISAQSVLEMHAMQAPFRTVDNAGYGLTFFVRDYKGVRKVGHTGTHHNFGGILDMVPEAGVAVVILFNQEADFRARAYHIVNQIFDDVLDLPREASPPQTTEPDAVSWRRHTGTYVSVSRGLAEINVIDDKLTLHRNGEGVSLSAHKEDVYFGATPKGDEILSVGFVPEDSGPTQYLSATVPSESSVAYRRVEIDSSFVPEPETWKSYTGTYTRDIETLTVKVEDGKLLLAQGLSGKVMPCAPLDNTRFACDIGLVEFLQEGAAPPTLRLGLSLLFTRK